MNTQTRVLVMIPAYNEEENIGRVIADIKEALPQADVVVIDGYSTDGTVAKAREVGVSVIKLPSCYGISGAVELGCQLAFREGYELLARVDADGQHSASDLVKMIGLIEQDAADIVIGSRHLDPAGYRNTLSRSLATKLFAWLVSLLTGQKFTDTASGLRVVNRDVIRHMALKNTFEYSEVEAIVLWHRLGFRVREVPVAMRQRAAGRSSFTPSRAFFYVFKGLLSLGLFTFRSIPSKEVYR